MGIPTAFHKKIQKEQNYHKGKGELYVGEGGFNQLYVQPAWAKLTDTQKETWLKKGGGGKYKMAGVTKRRLLKRGAKGAVRRSVASYGYPKQLVNGMWVLKNCPGSDKEYSKKIKSRAAYNKFTGRTSRRQIVGTKWIGKNCEFGGEEYEERLRIARNKKAKAKRAKKAGGIYASGTYAAGCGCLKCQTVGGCAFGENGLCTRCPQ